MSSNMNTTKILCLFFYTLVTALIIFSILLFAFDLDLKSICFKSCDLSNQELIDIVNLAKNPMLSDGQAVENRTEDIDFTGKYRMTKSENFDRFLEELGVNFLQRTIANRASAEYEITKDNDTYTLRTISPFKTSEISFKLNGEEFDETRMDGVRVRSSVVLKGNKWIHKQIDSDNKVVTIFREFKGDSIRVTGVVDNIAFVRIYNKL